MTTERQPKRKRGWLRSSLTLARRAALALGLTAAIVVFAWQQEKRRPVLPANAPPLVLTVVPGATVAEIGRTLHEHRLVRHPWIFRLIVIERRAANRLKAGEYRFTSGQTTEQMLDAIVRGDVVHRRVTFPEGRSIEEMALLARDQAQIPVAEFRKAAREVALVRDLDPLAQDLEGYLFPDTYEVPQRAQAAAALVARMVARFRRVVEPSLPLIRQRGLSLREVVTLASLVELETARAEERPRVAAVFVNRLKKRMPLQTDPTVIYALRKTGSYDGNIRKADLSIDSPYNTYRAAGLPPGPIASPGLSAIEAAVSPAPTQDLYFVSRNDGTHEFSANLTDHERAVDRYQRHRSPASTAPESRPRSSAAAHDH